MHFAGLHLGHFAQLVCVLRITTTLAGDFFKFDNVTNYMCDILRWPPLSQCIEFRILAWVWQCQLRSASSYLHVVMLPCSGCLQKS